MTFPERLKLIIGTLKREEFAAKIGKSARTVQRWELENVFPKVEELIKIAEEFNIDLHWLITGEGGPYIHTQNMGLNLAAISKEQAEAIRAKQGTTAALSGQLGRSVDMLSNVLNSGNQLYIQMVLSVLSSFDSAVRRTKHQDEEITQLKNECEELKKRVANLEETAPRRKKGMAA